jgi:hypothetical protein
MSGFKLSSSFRHVQCLVCPKKQNVKELKRFLLQNLSHARPTYYRTRLVTIHATLCSQAANIIFTCHFTHKQVSMKCTAQFTCATLTPYCAKNSLLYFTRPAFILTHCFTCSFTGAFSLRSVTAFTPVLTTF